MDTSPESSRTKRRNTNKDMNEYIIKTGLVNSIQKNFENKHLKNVLLNEINERVKQASQGIHRVSLILNLFIKEKHGNLDNIHFLSNKSTSFIYQIMIGQEKQGNPKTEFQDFIERKRHLFPPPPNRFPGDRNTFVRASEQYLINYRTMLETTFISNQKKMLYRWGVLNDIPHDRRWLLQRFVNGWTTNDVLEDQSVEVVQLVQEHRMFLGLEQGDRVHSEHFPKNNYELVLKYNTFLNNYLVQNDASLLCIVPMSRIKAHYIHIDSSVLYGILKSIGFLNCNESVFTEFRDHYWEYFFPRVKSLLTVNQRGPNGYANFTGTIQTDGIAINIHYRRPKLLNPEEFTKRDDDRVIGIDTGRVNIFYGVEELSDGKYRVYKFTRNEFYKKTEITNANRKIINWNQGIQESLNDLSIHAHRGSDIIQFQGYLHYIMEHYDTLWNEYLKRKWGRQRFNLYSRKQEFYSEFFNTLKDNSGRRIVLAYGDGKFDSSAPGERSVPTTRLASECSKRFKVFPIDEFRTSRINSMNNSILNNVRKGTHDIRGLQWCPTIRKFINRDKNSSISHMKLYHSFPERPGLFSRNTPNLPNKISITFGSHHWRSIDMAT